MIWLHSYNLKHPRDHESLLYDEEIRDVDTEKEAYSSLFGFDEEIVAHIEEHGSVKGFAGKTYGNYFVLDFDSKDNPKAAAEAAVPLLDQMDDLDMRYYLFFSGRKGIHLYIPKQYVAYNEELESDWCTASRLFVEGVLDAFPEMTEYLDNGIYQHTRMFRYPFSWHPKGRKDKMLMKYNPEHPKLFLVDKIRKDHVIADIFSGMPLVSDDSEILLSIRDRKPTESNLVPLPEPEYDDEGIELFRESKGMRPCITHMLNDRNITGSRHQTMLRIMSFFNDLGFPAPFIRSQLMAWNKRLVEPMSQDEIETNMKYYHKYNFGCNDHIRKKYCDEACPIIQRRRDREEGRLPYDPNERQDSLAAIVRQWIDEARGGFSIRDVLFDLGINDRKDGKNVSKILTRFEDEGIIERSDEKRYGMYRVVDLSQDDIDWEAADETPIPMRWPFNIQELVDIMPGNIIIVAGEPNSGKTAFLMNVAIQNRHLGMPIKYFSSEMGAKELRARIKRFRTVPRECWKDIQFKERAQNFHQVIDPDGINIIDFLEVVEDYHLVGKMIFDIFLKINGHKGIAIIALQKQLSKNHRRGEEDTGLGRGGVATLEKARLYLALSRRKCRIIKAKNRVEGMPNPNHAYIKFSIKDGSQFIHKMDGWVFEGENNDDDEEDVGRSAA